MKRKALGIAVAVAVGVLSGAAYAASPNGGATQRGSLLIFPKIDVTGATDTWLTIVNDSDAAGVRLKCFYATSESVPTPYTGTSSTAAAFAKRKYKTDFEIDLTHNQTVTWSAKTGVTVTGNKKIAQPFFFGAVPAGEAAKRTLGEMKCWAMTDDFAFEKHWNFLHGDASVINAAQAYGYNAYAFQAVAAPADLVTRALGSPGALNLNAAEYDSCPKVLNGTFLPRGNPFDERTTVTLASCNQDLRQNNTPTITKLTYTFWNSDEQPRSGAHECADSWYETTFFPWFDARQFELANWDSLGSASMFRIETTADAAWCGPSVTTSAYVGIVARAWNAEAPIGAVSRANSLTGRGSAVVDPVILYDSITPNAPKM